MQATNKEIISNLNNVIAETLTAINQYFLHARMMKHNGHMELADYEYGISIQKMKHSDRLVERVLALGGIPNLQDLGKLYVGETIDEILNCDLKREDVASKALEAAVYACETAKDTTSIELLARIRENAQEHISFIQSRINSASKAA